MLRRVLFTAVLLLVVLLATAWVLLVQWPLHNPHPPLQLAHGILAIRDATIYTSPDDPPLHHASILIRDGRIAAVGSGITIPTDAQLLPCNACVVTAGFWNTHIHLMQPRWSFAAYRPASALNDGLRDMLTSRGFTTAVDLASNLADTVSIRRRIETGNLLGPHIYTAGAAQYPPHGIPFYVRETMPPLLVRLFPQPDTPAEAARDEQRNLRAGADLLKLFTGSLVTHHSVLPMPVANAGAAVAVAHAHGQLAFCHPSNREGVMVGIESGVDVLAHAPSVPQGVDRALLQTAIDHHMSMIPTLKMFATTVTTDSSFLDPIVSEVRQFHALGGNLLFGTDVGYMTDYSTQDEFRYLAAAGLNATDILRMLTTAPAARFGVSAEKGRIAPGMLADVAVLGVDPATDVTAFSDVQITIRSGRILYTR